MFLPVLKDKTPFKQRPRAIQPNDFEAVWKHLQTLLDAWMICEVRLCIDYHKLNAQTSRDAYALASLEEAFAVKGQCSRHLV